MLAMVKCVADTLPLSHPVLLALVDARYVCGFHELVCPQVFATRRDAVFRFHLMESIGCPTRLRTLNMSSSELRKHIAENVNLERVENNPRTLGKEQVFQLLEFIV